MFDVLRSIFAERPAAPQAPDARLAAAALLVEAARADGAADPAETAAVERFLAHAFGLDPGEARAARLAGEAAQADAPDLVRFTRVLKGALDREARVALMAALWRVVLTDGAREPHEDALMRKLTPLLGLDDHDSAAARRRAAGK